jgi:HEAT repeat protein
LHALGDRRERVTPPAVVAAAKSGPKPVRIAAVGAIGRLGDESSVSTLLEIATEKDEELAKSAKTALAGLSGKKVDAAIAERLKRAKDESLAVLIELVGVRRIDATAPLIAAVDHSDAAVRQAALTALGATVGPQELPVLVKKAIVTQNPAEAEVAHRALRAAAVRMPDREATAAQLAAVMSEAPPASKGQFLETLGAMGGPKALAALAAAAKSGDAQLQDTSTRLLGEWMSADAGPTLLDLSKSIDGEKYQVRALRGYIRLARQFDMPDEERALRCEKALDVAKRIDEQKLVLQVLERYPSADTLKVAVKAQQIPDLKEEAANIASAISRKLNDKGGKGAKGRAR